MKGTGKTVELDGRDAHEVTITACRGEADTAGDDLPEYIRQRRDQVLARLLGNTGIPADDWTIRTEPHDANCVKGPEVPTAALAAILRADAGDSGPGAADDAVMLGVWRLSHGTRGDVEITGVQGDAIRLRWAAENGRTAAAPVWQSSGGAMPRNRTTRYHDIRTVQDLQAVLNGGRRPEVQGPVGGAQPPENGREHEHLLADRVGILRELIRPIEEAVMARRPLLIRTDPETRGEPGVPGLAAGRIANLISPAMTPDEQQHVLETYDLAGMTPPGGMPTVPCPNGGTDRPIPRPLRYPHSTTGRGTLQSIDRTSVAPRRSGRRRPGEVDLAAHGVIVIEVDEDMHLDRDAAEAVRDDIEHRTENPYTLLAVGDDAWMKKSGGYPLRDIFEFTANWSGKRATGPTVDAAGAREAGLKLIDEARRRVTDAWL